MQEPSALPEARQALPRPEAQQKDEHHRRGVPNLASGHHLLHIFLYVILYHMMLCYIIFNYILFDYVLQCIHHIYVAVCLIKICIGDIGIYGICHSESESHTWSGCWPDSLGPGHPGSPPRNRPCT